MLNNLKGTDYINFKFSEAEKQKLVGKAKQLGFKTFNDYLLSLVDLSLKHPKECIKEEAVIDIQKPVTLYLSNNAKDSFKKMSDASGYNFKELILKWSELNSFQTVTVKQVEKVTKQVAKIKKEVKSITTKPTFELNVKVTLNEHELINQIVHRAQKELKSINGFLLVMDIKAIHNHIEKIDFKKFLASSKEDFAHDIYGIIKHLDRDKLELTKCFLPRVLRGKQWSAT